MVGPGAYVGGKWDPDAVSADPANMTAAESRAALEELLTTLGKLHDQAVEQATVPAPDAGETQMKGMAAARQLGRWRFAVAWGLGFIDGAGGGRG